MATGWQRSGAIDDDYSTREQTRGEAVWDR
jgi:hypothetical protein